MRLQHRVLAIEHEVQIEALEDFAKGQVREVAREKPFVLAGEEDVLSEAKQTAVKLFPTG